VTKSFLFRAISIEKEVVFIVCAADEEIFNECKKDMKRKMKNFMLRGDFQWIPLFPTFFYDRMAAK
jgi:hypothetical protein